ncbi:MAG: hypothetical protein ACOYLH_09285 [Flavobacteriales bacterium]
MSKSVIILLKGIGLFLLAVCSFGFALYVRTEWYDFEEPSSFAGRVFYNPYADWNGRSGMMCNFHAHAECWSGLTNGKGSADEVLQRYDSLGYDVAGVSDYHRMTRPSHKYYEHGWGISKTHQLVLGATGITWLDFPFFQNEHQKQFMIDRLSGANEGSVVVLAHPSLRGAYSEEDIAHLGGYHCFEAVNKLRKSLKLWDVALSNGHSVFVLGSDDCHNYSNINDVGRCGTYVLTKNPTQQSLNICLKTGRHFAVEFATNEDEAVKSRREKVRSRFPLTKIEVDSTMYLANFNDTVTNVVLIGDHSDTLYKGVDLNEVSYVIPDSVTYVRMEYSTQEGHRVYLNPVFRTQNGELRSHHLGAVNLIKTTGYRIGIILLIILVWAWVFRNRYVKFIKKYRSNRGIPVFGGTPVYSRSRVVRGGYRIRYR